MSSGRHWWNLRTTWWITLAVTMLVAATVTAIALPAGGASVAYMVASGVWAPLGLVVWYRRPEHPMGPLLTLVGLSSISVIPGFLMGSFFDHFTVRMTPQPLTMVVSLGLSGAYTYLFVLAILLFPEGRPVSRPQRWLTGLAVLMLVATMVSGFLARPSNDVAHPFLPAGVADSARALYEFSLFVLYGFVMVTVIIMKIADFRHSESIRRTQLKWLMFVLVLYMSFTIVGFGLIGADNWGDERGLILDAIFTGLIPSAMAVAILRYRLYEIDRLISRTVTYATVALVVAAVFAVPVVLLPSWLAADSQIVVAGSTLAAAAVFAPVRRRVQWRVDRRFNRSRYDAEAEVGALARRLSATTDLGDLTIDTCAVVQRTLAPSSLAMWVRPLHRERP